MPFTSDHPTSIYYEADADAGGRPIVFIEGLGSQLIGWRQSLLDRFRADGFRVVRLDNRDVGLSAKLGEPGDTERRYAIHDMAGDVVAVLDALGLADAHIVGQSMGGAIAQSLAIHFPDRVRSLALVYTAPDFAGPFWGEAVMARRAMPRLAPDATREQAIAYRVAAERLCLPDHFPFDEDHARASSALAWDRCSRTDGNDRQLAALVETSDHRARLGELRMPTTIIHGRADPLVRYEASLALAALVPHADLHLYARLAHALPEAFNETLFGVVARNAAAADAPAAA